MKFIYATFVTNTQLMYNQTIIQQYHSLAFTVKLTKKLWHSCALYHFLVDPTMHLMTPTLTLL